MILRNMYHFKINLVYIILIMKCKLIIFYKKCPKGLKYSSLFLNLNQYLRRLILYTKSILPYDIIALNLWINRSA